MDQHLWLPATLSHPACSLPTAREKHSYETNGILQVNHISLRAAGPGAVFLGGVCHANGMAYLRKKGLSWSGVLLAVRAVLRTTHSHSGWRPKAGQGDSGHWELSSAVAKGCSLPELGTDRQDPSRATGADLLLGQGKRQEEVAHVDGRRAAVVARCLLTASWA